MCALPIWLLCGNKFVQFGSLENCSVVMRALPTWLLCGNKFVWFGSRENCSACLCRVWLENAKKCKTAECRHGDCGNQDDAVGGANADLIAFLLLPFSSLHEPIPQHWIQVGFLKKKLLPSAYQNAWLGLTDWRNQEDALTICRCHFIRITGCVMWTLRLEESTGWTNLVDCLRLAPLQPMLFASLGHAGYSSIMLLSTWAAQDTCTALAWLSIAGAASNSNIVSGRPMIRSWLWPALGTENCQLCFYLL